MVNALVQFMIAGSIVTILTSLVVKKHITQELSIVIYIAGITLTEGLVPFMILISAIGVTFLGKLDKETVILFMIGVTGLLVIEDALEFIVIYIGIEISGLAFYILAARERESAKSTEAGVKYFVLGALGSGLMLLGMTMTYAQSGLTYVGVEPVLSSASIVDGTAFTGPWVNMGTLILVGLYFKIGAAPFHMWLPDVYEGSSTKVTAYFAVVPKIAYLAIIMHVGMALNNLVIGTLSIIIGSIGAINQTSLKRMLAYSGIGHVGFMLLGLATNTAEGLQSVMIYYVLYVIMTLSTFMIIITLGIDKIAELRGLSRRNGALGMTLGLIMMSLAGVPPLVGFLSKYLIIKSVIEVGAIEWAIVAIVVSVISSFYYVRLIRFMYFEDKSEVAVELPTPQVGTAKAYILGWLTYIIVTFMFYPLPLLVQTGIVV